MVTLLFGTLAVCLILTVPIGISLALASVAVISTGYSSEMLNMLAQSTVTALDNFTLMAIPFFMLLGIVMEKTGIAKDLVGFAEAMVGQKAGSLGNACIVACAFFAAISGSGPACVAAIGGVMVPIMIEEGYPKGYSGAIAAAGSTIGPVIPPSIPLIVYGATVGVSVTGLFAAGVIPGIAMAVVLIAWNKYVCKKHGYGAAKSGHPTAGISKWTAFKKAFWSILMPVIVLGGIYGGVFTPTEASVVGVVYALVVGTFVYRRLTWRIFLDCLTETAVTASAVLIIMGAATTFGRIITLERVPEMLAAWMLSVSESPFVIMLMINILLLIAGMFIDTTSNVILFAPLFCPIVSALGYDLTYFGIVMCINLCIGFLTPPLGVNLFVAQRVSGTTLEDVIRYTWPMIIVLTLLMVVVIAFPAISLFLPKLMGIV